MSSIHFRQYLNPNVYKKYLKKREEEKSSQTLFQQATSPQHPTTNKLTLRI
jgi:hypothetical protein